MKMRPLVMIAVKLEPAAKSDRLDFERSDGSHATVPMPRQGILPHDLVHFVVERNLGPVEGFLSLVARGADPDYTQTRLHDGRRIDYPSEAIWIEAIVEALQAQLWAGHFDAEAFVYGATKAYEARDLVSPRAAPADAARRWFDEAVELNRAWQMVMPGGKLRLTLP